MIEALFKIISCHLVGDYVFQIDYIAKTKGDNWYNLLVHCLLYTLPFYLAFGFSWYLGLILISHIIIDTLKARYKKINYLTDQILHISIALVYLIN